MPLGDGRFLPVGSGTWKVGAGSGLNAGRVISGMVGFSGTSGFTIGSGGLNAGLSKSVFIFSMAEAFASVNAIAEDLSNELFVKGDSIAADAVAKQIAIARQVLRTIFHFWFMIITTYMRISI
jgi:hypothetical protein